MTPLGSSLRLFKAAEVSSWICYSLLPLDRLQSATRVAWIKTSIPNNCSYDSPTTMIEIDDDDYCS
jgi:hypothetical protein